MLSSLIPAYDLEMEALRSAATSGYILGFDYTLQHGIRFIENAFPARWQRKYHESAFLLHDPVVKWFTTELGFVRWSSIGLRDPEGVLTVARRYKMNFGAVFSVAYSGKRHFMSVARPERELFDAECAHLLQRFTVWSQAVTDGMPKLDDGEIAVLRCFSQGMDKAEAAATLDVSISTIKLRQTSAIKKLHARSLTQAISFAASAGFV